MALLAVRSRYFLTIVDESPDISRRGRAINSQESTISGPCAQIV
jgi:hypothetical protein